MEAHLEIAIRIMVHFVVFYGRVFSEGMFSVFYTQGGQRLLDTEVQCLKMWQHQLRQKNKV